MQWIVAGVVAALIMIAFEAYMRLNARWEREEFDRIVRERRPPDVDDIEL